MKNKVIALLMSIILVISMFGISIYSFAEDLDTPVNDEIIEEYQVIFNHTSGINIVGVTAKCNASLGAQYSTTLTITMELQKKSSGVYSTIKTWSDSRTGTIIALEGSKVINILNSYRLKTTFTAGNETVVVYSNPT